MTLLLSLIALSSGIDFIDQSPGLNCTNVSVEIVGIDDDKPAEVMVPQEEFLRQCTVAPGVDLTLVTEPELVTVPAHTTKEVTYIVKDSNGNQTAARVILIRE